MRILKRVGVVVALLLIIAFLAGSYLLGSEAVPDTTRYELDLTGLRELATSAPGELPVELRLENVADGGLPRGLIMAGEDFDTVTMPRPVFQVLYPDGTYVLIDTAYDRSIHD